MKKYLKPLAKNLRLGTEHSFLQSGKSIYHEVSQSEDAANVGMF